MTTIDAIRIRTSCIVCVLLLLPIVSMAQGAWKQLPRSVEGAPVSSIVLYNGDTLFLGTSTQSSNATQQSVYRSTDNGVTWHRTRTGRSDGWVRDVTVHRRSVYASTNEGLYRSDDAGGTWTLLSNGIDSADIWDFLAVDSTLYVAYSLGVAKSTDDGASWIDCSTGLFNQEAIRLHYADSTLFALTEDAVFRSTNGGERWLLATEGLGLDYNGIVDIASSNGECFLAGRLSVYRSTNAGQSWAAMGRGGARHMFWLDSSFTIVTDSGLYRLPAGDTVRMPVETGRVSPRVTTSLVNKGVLIAGTTHGVYRSGINDVVWTSSSSGIHEIPIKALVQQGEWMFAGTEQGLFRRTSGGDAWVWTGNNLGVQHYVDLLAVGRDTLFATDFGRILRSTNAGVTWQQMVALHTDQIYRDIRASYVIRHRNTLLASGVGTLIYRSTDNGRTWLQVQSSMPPNSTIRSIVSNNRVVLVTLQGGLYRSTDDGVTWSRVDNVTWSADHIIACDSAIVTCAGKNVYRSTDDGVTWELLNTILPGRTLERAAKASGNDIYRGTSTGVFLSSDIGTTWTERNAGLNDRYVTCISVDGTTVYAGTSQGFIYVWDDDATSVDDPTHDVVTADAQGIAVHPVPARDRITVAYSTNEPEHVRIEVMTGNGQVIHFHTAYQQEGGEHTLDMNTSTWPSGVYFITVQTQRRTYSTTVLVVR